ncbi:universal stress protein [Spirulina sp. CS-785/01]|uniref:universal stress protein n=1 Tax=Spirulina sp. CS-785/01 TaxID=3021716 RepID=UPI00232EEFD2|nr:universal stress protein [Spirulina sp. CS-785/01]MDB9312458.1 universal stress protein [Spirulina sp. CS-785/01]
MSLLQCDRLLVPIDFSEASFQAQQEALQLMEESSELHVLHILPPLNPGEPGVKWHTIDKQKRIENVKKNFWQRFGTPEYQTIKFHVEIGNPGAKILDYTKKNNIDLIVIPSHGRTGLRRFLLGSVAERVVRYAPCPVLVLRRKDVNNN